MEEILKTIMDIINDLSKCDYSDIHIKSGEKIAIRFLGEIHFLDYIVEYSDIVSFLEKVIGISKYENENFEKDFSFSYEKYRYRGNVFFSMGKISLSLRKISHEIKSFKELNIAIEEDFLCDFSSGLVFITGATGSGKTTSLAAIIQHINENSKKHIITIEDPVEYTFKNKKSIITQREVGRDTSSFSSAIKSSLRQDPDIIVIGEIRDKHTMKAAINAAQTGHLCFCTLHTIGAVSTIERILGFFSNEEKEEVRFELSMILKAIFSQQLVKIEEKRIPIVEFLSVEKSISNIIKEGKINQIQNYIHINSSKGLISMDSELLKIYYEGKITEKTIFKICLDKEYIQKNINKIFI